MVSIPLRRFFKVKIMEAGKQSGNQSPFQASYLFFIDFLDFITKLIDKIGFGAFQWIDLMSGRIIDHLIFRIRPTFNRNHDFLQNRRLLLTGLLFETGLFLQVCVQPSFTKWPDGRILESRFFMKQWIYNDIYQSDRGLAGKMNSFHRDSFSGERSERVLLCSEESFFHVRKNQLGRQPGHFWQGPFFSGNNMYPIFWTSFRWFLDSMNMNKTRKNSRKRVHKVSSRNVWYGPSWWQKGSLYQVPSFDVVKVVCQHR